MVPQSLQGFICIVDLLFKLTVDPLTLSVCLWCFVFLLGEGSQDILALIQNDSELCFATYNYLELGLEAEEGRVLNLDMDIIFAFICQGLGIFRLHLRLSRDGFSFI